MSKVKNRFVITMLITLLAYIIIISDIIDKFTTNVYVKIVPCAIVLIAILAFTIYSANKRVTSDTVNAQIYLNVTNYAFFIGFDILLLVNILIGPKTFIVGNSNIPLLLVALVVVLILLIVDLTINIIKNVLLYKILFKKYTPKSLFLLNLDGQLLNYFSYLLIGIYFTITTLSSIVIGAIVFPFIAYAIVIYACYLIIKRVLFLKKKKKATQVSNPNSSNNSNNEENPSNIVC